MALLKKLRYFKIAQKILNIWANFKRKFVTRNLKKSPNRVTLADDDIFVKNTLFQVDDSITIVQDCVKTSQRQLASFNVFCGNYFCSFIDCFSCTQIAVHT